MESLATLILLILFSLLCLFHLLVLFKIIPYNIVWGGRLKNDRQMIVFEIFSLVLNASFIYFFASLLGFVDPIAGSEVYITLMWIMVGIFTLNTLGNLRSESRIEEIIFTPLTILITTLLLVILLS
jgi:hypothetical protein